MSSQFVKKVPLLILFLSLALFIQAKGADRVKAKTTPCAACGKLQSGKKAPCHPANYVDPKVAVKYSHALRDMKRAGVQPKVTSAWRSSEKQAALYRCSNSPKCRNRNPGLYYAKPPGTSAHEAGLAVDISGIAAGPRGAKRVTRNGRKIIHIMEKNGFKWRYGLKDPAHFEANPKKAGYRNLSQAIHKTQTTCTVKVNARTKRQVRG